MRIGEIFEGEDDHLHAQKLQQTGFWGAQGAGCIFLARDTKRFLIAHRSAHVEQPNSWGTWGGAIDRNEAPEHAAKREATEESGYNGPLRLLPLYVFEAKKNGEVAFRYHNFLAIVENEFTPRLDWESQGFRWCEFGNWPSPLHFGLKAILNDPHSIAVMKRASAA
jgi:8-oxo-dGTP pyrophosphatase MutT (NUDIX family)